jgi:cysteine desulfurase / selenocysteine lyase
VNIEKIRADFPILRQQVNGHPLVYLDNAATTQKPRSVIDAVKNHFETTNANIHRAMHSLGEQATADYENAHKKAADFVRATGTEEIVFTKNTTECINLVAHGFYDTLNKGDEIVLTEMEHHSNLVPWLMLAKKKGAHIQYIPVQKNGELDISQVEKVITNKTKIVSFTHASNVLGTINPVKEIIAEAQKHGALTLIDAAQSIPHMTVDVKKLGVDFACFSSHKMLGPSGIGILYGKKERFEKLPPMLGGGEMISEVHFDRYTLNTLPWKFEAGTMNIEGAIGFSAALDYLNMIGMENVEKHTNSITHYALDKLQEMGGITLYGPEAQKRTSLVSFNVKNIHSHDIATILDGKGIAIRAGHHCAQPLMRKLGMVGSARASFYLYNTKEEVDKLIEGIKLTQSVLKK